MPNIVRWVEFTTIKQQKKAGIFGVLGSTWRTVAIMDDCLICCIIEKSEYLLGVLTGIFVKWLSESYSERQLQRGHFIGLQWQRDLFEGVINKAIPRDMVRRIVSETKNWTRKDLSKFYSPTRIEQFYANREQMRKDPRNCGCSIVWKKEFDRKASKKIEKMINKIYGEIDTVLKYDLLPEINSLQSKTPSIDNFKMATAKAKEQQLKDLNKMKEALTNNIRKNVAELLKSVINYEQSKNRLYNKYNPLMKAQKAIKNIYYRIGHILHYVRNYVAELLKSKNKVYDEYEYNALIFWGWGDSNYRNQRKNIYYRIGRTLYYVRKEIDRELFWEKKVELGIDFLKDVISHYKTSDDAESTAYVKRLSQECDDLNNIWKKLFAIKSDIITFPDSDHQKQ